MRAILPFLLASLLGVLPSCDRAKKKPPEPEPNVVVAKLVVQPDAVTAAGSGGKGLEDFYDAQVGLLGNDGLKKQAEAKALTLGRLDGPAPAVTVQVARIAGSSVVTLIARSGSPDYAKLYLESLIEFYITKVNGASVETPLSAASDNASAVAKAELILKDADRALSLFKLENASAGSDAELTNLQRRLKRLLSAQSFYEGELALTSKATLETDILRRKNGGLPPADMPDDFVRLVSGGITPNEQAYLDSLNKSDAPTTAATQVTAEQDQKARIVSFQHQLDTVKDLAEDIQKRLAHKMQQRKEQQKLEAAMETARAAYAERQTKSQSDAVPTITASAGVSVAIMEKPSMVTPSK